MGGAFVNTTFYDNWLLDIPRIVSNVGVRNVGPYCGQDSSFSTRCLACIGTHQGTTSHGVIQSKVTHNLSNVATMVL